MGKPPASPAARSLKPEARSPEPEPEAWRPKPPSQSTDSPTARISAMALLRVTGPGFMR